MLKTVLAATLAAVCASANAQVAPMSEAQFGSRLNKVLDLSVSSGRSLGQAVAERNAQADPVRLLERVMTAMYDGSGTGEKIVQWLRDHKAVVEFSDFVTGESAHTWLGDFTKERDIPAIYISPLLLKPPVSYRLLGSLIAKEGSELMLKDFPESAEKRAIVASRMAESYFELGGTRLGLPNFDGTVDEDAAATIRVWIENAPEQGVQLFHARGSKTLQEVRSGLLSESERLANLRQAIEQMLSVTPEVESLRGELGDAQAQSERILLQLEAVKKAEAEFKQFQQSETDWIMTHRPS